MKSCLHSNWWVLFVCLLLKGEALRITTQRTNLRKTLAFIASLLSSSMLSLAGVLFLYVHSALTHLMRAPVLWGLASLGLDGVRTTALLCCPEEQDLSHPMATCARRSFPVEGRFVPKRRQRRSCHLYHEQ